MSDIKLKYWYLNFSIITWYERLESYASINPNLQVITESPGFIKNMIYFVWIKADYIRIHQYKSCLRVRSLRNISFKVLYDYHSQERHLTDSWNVSQQSERSLQIHWILASKSCFKRLLHWPASITKVQALCTCLAYYTAFIAWRDLK